MTHIDIEAAEAQLGLRFQDKALLQRTLIHRSFLNETMDLFLGDNERLEFLGDAVLDFVTGEYLYHRYPETREGQLTSLRSALVRTESLAGFAQDIGLGSHLQMGRGEEESGGRIRPPILCAAFEALMGALYLDQGIEAVKDYFLPLIEPELRKILSSRSDRDPKSHFQEIAQGYHKITPSYQDLAEIGPDHAKEFTVGAFLNEVCYGEGTGASKQQAAQAAAQGAIQNLKAEIKAARRTKKKQTR